MFEQNGKIVYENEEFLEERTSCPKCDNVVYSSKAIEPKDLIIKVMDKNKSIPSSILVCKCSCGNMWMERLSSNHKRSHIRGHYMIGKF